MSTRSLTAAIALAIGLPVLLAARPPAKVPVVRNPGPAGTLTIAGREVLQVQPVGYYTGQDRAIEVMRRIARVIEPTNDQLGVTIAPFNAARDVRAGREHGKPVVQFKGITVATVTGQDQQAAGMAGRQVAQMWADNLKAGLDALNATPHSNEKRVLEAIQVGVGGHTVANAVTGVTNTTLANRIRRDIARDPQLRHTPLNVDVMSDRVIIRNDAVSTPREVRRLEQVIRQEVPDRPIKTGEPVGSGRESRP